MSLLAAAEYDLDTLDYLNRQERQVRQDAKNSVSEESPQENDDLVTNLDELKFKEMAEAVDAIEVREAAKSSCPTMVLQSD